MKVFVITGETASGKSSFALNLAKKINGTIINGDSQQVFRELPILSDQPTGSVDVHHILYGYKSIDDEFSSFLWLRDATKAIESCIKKGKVPIVVGGSGFYMRNLVSGHYDIQTNEKVTCNHSTDEMYKLINSININKNDNYRIERSFLLMQKTGKNMQQHIDSANIIKLPYKFVTILLKNNNIDSRILSRIEAIFEAAVNEVRSYIDHPNLYRILGFREIRSYILGDIDSDTAKNLMYIKIRQYAKRQRTWFRNKMTFDHILHACELENFIKTQTT